MVTSPEPALYLWPNSALFPNGERLVQKFDVYKFYALAEALSHLRDIRPPAIGGARVHPSVMEMGLACMVALKPLEEFLDKNLLNLEASVDAGKELLAFLKAGHEQFASKGVTTGPANSVLLQCLERSHSSFMIVLSRELPRRPTYIVGKKGGMKEELLIDNGEVFFPSELTTKAPDAIGDIQSGTRCIAFDLPTAAGYHFHRANESVLRVYFDAVTNNAPRPTDRSIGKYLQAMDSRNAGSPSIKASLRDLSKHHRNPLIHPEHSLKDTNEAIALMNAVHAVVVPMLAAIP